MLKYALVFTGIIAPTTADAMADVSRFMASSTVPARGLRLALTNNGPSRSGFASSSAVGTCLLQVLYLCSGQHDMGTDLTLLGSMVLLFENQLGLKSGRQDVDGLLPQGLKILRYAPTSGFVFPTITTWSEKDFDFQQLPTHFHLGTSL
jgi:hypothetical protein